MSVLVKTKVNGETVDINAGTLDTIALIGDGTIHISDDFDKLVANTDVLICEEESVLIGDAYDGNPRAITRAQNDFDAGATVAAEHAAGNFVLNQSQPFELLEYAFNGSTHFAGWTVSGEGAFWAQLQIGSVMGSPRYFASDAYPLVEIYRPREIVGAATWKVLVWTVAKRQFHGEIFN